VRTLFDPACGTGGMLSVAEDHLRSLNPTSRLEVFCQEVNDETYAICRSRGLEEPSGKRDEGIRPAGGHVVPWPVERVEVLTDTFPLASRL